MRGFNFSKRRLLFSAAAIGIGALALSNSDLLDHEQDNPKTSQALVDTVGPEDTKGLAIAAEPVVKFTPSEAVQQRLDDVHTRLSGTAEEYGVFHSRLRGDVSESERAQAQNMLDRLDVLNAELNEANASLVEEFIGFVDAHAHDGYVLIDFYDEECNACQDLDGSLEAGVALSDHSDMHVIKAEVVEYDALKMFKRTGSYPELQLLRVSDFQLMGVSEGAITPEQMAEFINNAVAGRYLNARPEGPEAVPGI